MSRVFDPNTNPYADDLWRLALAPPSRFSPRERKTMGHILAGKLYGLVTWQQGRLTYNLANVKFRGKRMREVVALVLLFDDELDYRTLESTAEAVARSNRADMVIVLNAGATGVVEIYYGSWGDAAFRSILEMPKHIRSIEFPPDTKRNARFLIPATQNCAARILAMTAVAAAGVMAVVTMGCRREARAARLAPVESVNC